jgi:hypothetical protein
MLLSSGSHFQSLSKKKGKRELKGERAKTAMFWEAYLLLNLLPICLAKDTFPQQRIPSLTIAYCLYLIGQNWSFYQSSY